MPPFTKEQGEHLQKYLKAHPIVNKIIDVVLAAGSLPIYFLSKKKFGLAFVSVATLGITSVSHNLNEMKPYATYDLGRATVRQKYVQPNRKDISEMGALELFSRPIKGCMTNVSLVELLLKEEKGVPITEVNIAARAGDEFVSLTRKYSGFLPPREVSSLKPKESALRLREASFFSGLNKIEINPQTQKYVDLCSKVYDAELRIYEMQQKPLK